MKEGNILKHILIVAYMFTVIRKVREEPENFDGDIIAYAKDIACWSQSAEKLRSSKMFLKKTERSWT